MAKAKGSQHRPGEVTALHVQRFKGPGKLKIGGGDLADCYIDSLEPTFKNDKARQPWELSLVTYAAAIGTRTRTAKSLSSATLPAGWTTSTAQA